VNCWQAGDSHQPVLEPQVLQLCAMKKYFGLSKNEQLRIDSRVLLRVLIK
jgi:hypothetical protein